MVKVDDIVKEKLALTQSLMELFWLVGEACAELSRIKPTGIKRSLLLHMVRLGTRRSYKAVVNSSCEGKLKCCFQDLSTSLLCCCYCCTVVRATQRLRLGT